MRHPLHACLEQLRWARAMQTAHRLARLPARIALAAMIDVTVEALPPSTAVCGEAPRWTHEELVGWARALLDDQEPCVVRLRTALDAWEREQRHA